MRDRYDFSEARRNPHASKLTTPVAVRLDEDTFGYFKEQAVKTGIPVSALISAHLRGCVARDHLSAVSRPSRDPESPRD